MMHGGRGLASAARRITSAPSILNTCSDCLAHSGLKAKDIFTFSSRNNERQQGSLRPVAFFFVVPNAGDEAKSGRSLPAGKCGRTLGIHSEPEPVASASRPFDGLKAIHKEHSLQLGRKACASCIDLLPAVWRAEHRPAAGALQEFIPIL